MRLDQALVARNLVRSRARARAAIDAGQVAVNGQIVRKPSHGVAEGDRLELVGEVLQWVSRAALKLVHGLEVFGVDPKGCQALDLGASTGGFSQVLLAGGAAHVTAIDVGHGQLDQVLKGHRRLDYREGVNARDLAGFGLPTPDLVVSDLSFISLTKALGPALAIAAPGAILIALVKPQFELERVDIGKGGIVKDPALRARAVQKVASFVTQAGWSVRATTDSPITGSDGNAETLLCAERRVATHG